LVVDDEVDDGEVVDEGEADVDEELDARSVAACDWACVVAPLASADGRSFLIAWPRLRVLLLLPVFVVLLLPVVDVPLVLAPVVLPEFGAVPAAGGVLVTGTPVIASFRSLNGMFRFCEV
jgi:hypothetical protein